jgi:hypothetical protein
MRPLSKLSLLLAAVLASALACRNDGPTSPLSPKETREVVAAMSRWAANAPAHYRYASTVSCFCPAIYSTLIVTEVRNGAVIASYYPNGSLYPYPTPPRPPIDSLFVQILGAGEWVARVEVTFDRTYGYPRSIDMISKPNIADGVYGMTITSFEPLP